MLLVAALQVLQKAMLGYLGWESCDKPGAYV